MVSYCTLAILYFSFRTCSSTTDYQDVVMNFFENKQHIRQSKAMSEGQELFLDLYLGLIRSQLDTVSAWKLLHSGAKMASAKNVASLETCVNSSLDTFVALGRRETWAIKMIDATGKLGCGVLKGNAMWLGSFSECMEITATRNLPGNHTEKLFDGQYCLAAFSSPNASTTNPLASLVISVGLCVPSTCSQENVRDIVNYAISSLTNGSVIAKVSQYQPKSIPLTASAIAMISVLSVIGFPILLGTLYDICIHQRALERAKSSVVVVTDPARASGSGSEETDHPLTVDEFTPLLKERTEKREVLNQGRQKSRPDDKKPSMPMRVLLALSIYTNGSKILATQRTPGSLDCVHGIRFLSMTWVILGHVCLFGVAFSKNPVDGLNWFNRWTFQAIGNATVSVDTFFVLSGALVCYLLLKELRDKNGPRHINWPLFYFHRFWRLTPMYMLVIGTYSTLFVYWGSGPQWPYEAGFDPNCKDNWWTNLLYINNFVSQSKQCMAWGWYLANDMQFFIISPIVVVAFYYRWCLGLTVSVVSLLISFLYVALYSQRHHTPTPVTEYELKEGLDGFKWYTGMLASLVLLITCFVSTSVIVVKHGFLTGIVDMLKPGQQLWFDHLYIKPWCRIGPYIVGIITGYLLHVTDKQKPKIHKSLVALGWALAATCNLAVLYGLVDYSQGASISVGLSAFYNACARTAWGIGVAWVMFACCRGYGGFVNTLLSWPAMIPLSRLTYAAYLVHPVILMYYFLSQEDRLFLTDLTYIWLFLGSLVMTYMFAFVTSLAFESPMMVLEKVVFKRN